LGLGIDRGILTVDKYQITSPPDINVLQGIFQQEGIIINYFPFCGNINAIYVRTLDGIEMLTIKSNLTEIQIKCLLAYGYAYRALNQPFNPCTHVKVIKNYLEYEIDTEAEDFTAILLVPPLALSITDSHIPACKICSIANVPESLALRRIEIANKYSI